MSEFEKKFMAEFGKLSGRVVANARYYFFAKIAKRHVIYCEKKKTATQHLTDWQTARV